ncbi:hypothetical protein [Algoriphagus sp. AK58]|uniref:hypothetical protein n=1 Tax=Algoriphagus sp. AK58 TaxID=1406877 RepID=UPI00164F5170|nr:hypothetical protein [Algoriphagus sp. AK58]MBC6367613.1 hypothetical protein [Algoriphagus sp. AK58]
MTNGKTIFISIILIISGVVIKTLIDNSNTGLDKDLIGFFSGIVFGAGIGLLFSLIFKKKKVND